MKTILVIDDEASLLKAVAYKLKEAGYGVLEARDGVEGLKLALDKHPDLILLDLKMPKMDGHTMLKELRADEWGSNVPVVILSNSNSDDSVYKALQQSVQDYFVKTDVSLQEILDDVKSRIGVSDS